MRPILLALSALLAACTSRASIHGSVAPAAPSAASSIQAPVAPAEHTTLAPATRPEVTVFGDVVRVVDGDTIHVKVDGKVEKLRLLSVDTEEKLGSGAGSATKPQTVFGEACALWAQAYFKSFEQDGAPVRVGLLFPKGREHHRDVYGRLLCHLILPDGVDFNLLLVKLGKSPYFTKYGYSEIDHAAFAAAQKDARAKHLGIWDPATNKAKTEGTPSAVRPYDQLLPWWDARAEAVQAFETLQAKKPERVFESESGASLARAVEASATKSVLVFGEIDRIFDEDDGSQTVLMRAAERDQALRVHVPKESVPALASAKLAERREEFQQNYVWYEGRIERSGSKGYRSTCTDPASWRDGRTP